MEIGKKIVAMLTVVFIAGMAMLCSSPAFAKEYGDIVMYTSADSMKKAGVKPVKFSHWFHRIRYKCKVCHEDIFVMKAGANNVNMNLIMEGKACGTCHNGKIAWEPMYCDKCHSSDEMPPALSQAPQAPQDGKGVAKQ